MKKAIVIGSGAGGSTVARELQGAFEVTILEAGKKFQPFTFNLKLLEKLRKTGLFFDERLIQLLFPAIKIHKTGACGELIVVNGRGTGGSTALSTGTALRMDGSLKNFGINLENEFRELQEEIPISISHKNSWSKLTKEIYEICEEMGFNPFPSPKMGDYNKCINCGRCVLGCPEDVKWDSRQFLDTALKNGAKLITGCRVEKLVLEANKVVAVQAKKGWQTSVYTADLIILAAGGLGTPIILENSGIFCEEKLFVDPVLCVAGRKQDSYQNKELSMPFIIRRENYIISPYFDYLNFFFNRDWKYQAGDIVSLMIKLADTNKGSMKVNGLDKQLTIGDRVNLQEGIEICTEILNKLGIKKDDIFLGNINGGHPGGMFPLTEKEKDNFHNERLPENLYIADSTLLPESTGNPLILTIMALAKRIGKICRSNF